MNARLFQEDETAAEERAMEARSTPVWLGGKSGNIDGTRSAVVLTVFKSTLADLSSGSAVFLGGDAAASGNLGFVGGFF